MSSAKSIPESPAAASAGEKRVILSIGGKGGVGKTSVVTGLNGFRRTAFRSSCSTSIPKTKLADR